MLAQSRFSSVMFQSLSVFQWNLVIIQVSHKYVSTNKPTSYSTVREYLNSTFKAIVRDIAAFSIHSLRAGGDSAAKMEDSQLRVMAN